MTDRELLGLAAKAAEMNDLEHGVFGLYKVLGVHEGGQKCLVEWNPLTNDGDALRLAVKLKLNIQLEYSPTYHYADNDEYECLEDLNGCCTKGSECGDDPCAATRRAIVRAAAEIGKWME